MHIVVVDQGRARSDVTVTTEQLLKWIPLEFIAGCLIVI